MCLKRYCGQILCIEFTIKMRDQFIDRFCPWETRKITQSCPTDWMMSLGSAWSIQWPNQNTQITSWKAAQQIPQPKLLNRRWHHKLMGAAWYPGHHESITFLENNTAGAFKAYRDYCWAVNRRFFMRIRHLTDSSINQKERKCTSSKSGKTEVLFLCHSKRLQSQGI